MVCICEVRGSRPPSAIQTVKIIEVRIEETNLQANFKMVIIEYKVNVLSLFKKITNE